MSRTHAKTGAERTLDLLAGQVGRTLDEIETPVVVLDLDRLEANLKDLQSYADQHGIALWPHTKTHKSPEIGLMQLDYGARGLTVAKTGEAQVFHEAGARSLLIHYPPFGRDKWERLAELVAEGTELTVAVDSITPAEGLSDSFSRRGLTASVLVELDLGLHRTGQTTAEGAVALGKELSRAALARRRRDLWLSRPLPWRRGDDPLATRSLRRLPPRYMRRVPRRRNPLRSDLRRLDADALPDPRYVRE